MSLERISPRDDSVAEETVALVIQRNGQKLWKFEKPAPWEDAEWELKKNFSHSEIPNPLELQEARIEQVVTDDGLIAVTVYADTIASVEEKQPQNETRTKELAPNQPRNQKGYFITLSDNAVIPDEDSVHTSQKENMGAAMDYLIEEYDLTDLIELPYRDPRTGKTSLISTEPKINERKEMNNPYELTDGNYLQTTMGRTEKMNSMKEIAGLLGLNISFGGRWHEK